MGWDHGVGPRKKKPKETKKEIGNKTTSVLVPSYLCRNKSNIISWVRFSKQYSTVQDRVNRHVVSLMVYGVAIVLSALNFSVLNDTTSPKLSHSVAATTHREQGQQGNSDLQTGVSESV